MDGLYFYKLVSNYPEDVTKNCKLTVNEIDGNFLTLKNADIKSYDFDCGTNVLTLTRNNGEKLSTDLTCALSGMTRNLDVSFDDCKGDLVIEYNGEKHTYTGFLTKKNLADKDEDDKINVMSKAITDGTILGDGTTGNPLSLNPIERTGFYRPALRLVDGINGENLPECKEKGDRYLSYEYSDEYGKLYNYSGVKQIENLLTNGWRIPTKSDWDNMLNAIEPCTYRNHQSTKCHIELGKFAGKKLKDKGTWCGEETYSACTNDTDEEYYLDPESCPKDKPVSPTGTNDYGFNIKPAGYAIDDENKIKQCEWGAFWTSSQTMPGAQSDYYVKIFENKRSGVVQMADCPQHYYSLRLVKDYDGSNAHESEYFEKLRKSYPTVLLPTLKSEDNPNNQFEMSVWTSINVDFETEHSTWDEIKNIKVGDPTWISPFYEDENPEKKRVYVINEWDGKQWERRVLIEGDTIVLNEPVESGHTKDTEYRIVNGKLTPTDELVYERLFKRFMSIIHEIENQINGLSEKLDEEIKTRKNEDERIEQEYQAAIEQERIERISGDTEILETLSAETEARETADEELWKALSAETEARTSGETAIWEALSAETEARETADEEFSKALSAETEARISGDTKLQEAIDQEKKDREDADEELLGKILKGGTEYTIYAKEGTTTFVSNDGKPENSITLKIVSDFGEI